MPTAPDVSLEPLAAPLSASAVPSLNDLYHATPQNDRMVVRGVDWAYYKRVLELVGERRGIRLAYDGKDLEIMSPGPVHEDYGRFAGYFVELVALELLIPFRAMASTPWERPELDRGIEADDCFYFQPEKLAQAAAALKRKSNDVADYPNPDLGIEIDIWPPKVDRLGIYAALRVMEIWQFGSSSFFIRRLKEDGTCESVDASGFLPVRADQIVRWVLGEDKSDVTAWMGRLREWIRTELAGRSGV